MTDCLHDPGAGAREEGAAMTPQETEDLAARALAAIDANADAHGTELRRYSVDRERVASDLAGLRDHAPTADAAGGTMCAACPTDEPGYFGTDWPCADARRYADGLRRTAALYGVTA